MNTMKVKVTTLEADSKSKDTRIATLEAANDKLSTLVTDVKSIKATNASFQKQLDFLMARTTGSTGSPSTKDTVAATPPPSPATIPFAADVNYTSTTIDPVLGKRDRAEDTDL